MSRGGRSPRGPVAVFDADLNSSVGVDTCGTAWSSLLRGERDLVVVGATIVASDFGAEDAYEARVVAVSDFGPEFVVYWHKPAPYEPLSR